MVEHLGEALVGALEAVAHLHEQRTPKLGHALHGGQQIVLADAIESAL